MNTDPRSSHQIIRGGLLLDVQARLAAPADILIEGDTIIEVGPPGMVAPEGAKVIDAADRLVMPGLVNAHTHGHGSLVLAPSHNSPYRKNHKSDQCQSAQINRR